MVFVTRGEPFDVIAIETPRLGATHREVRLVAFPAPMALPLG